MQVLHVEGGFPLQGTVQASGAKTVATKLIVASLISKSASVFYNVPCLPDVMATLKMCQEVGMEYTFDEKNKRLEVCTKSITNVRVSDLFSGSNRVPILLVGALLSRVDDEITVPVQKSTSEDFRPYDYHFEALRSLGATISVETLDGESSIHAVARNGLVGARIHLPYPSVGTTENCVMAAVGAKGTTIIHNAAIEPEVIDLILYLQKMGAYIVVDTDRTITIQGTKVFSPVEHHLMADRTEVAAFASLALATRGRIFVEGAEHRNCITLLNAVREVSGRFMVRPNGIEFFADQELTGGIHVETDVHPGFMTDWQQPFVVMLTQANGASIVHETVFENRFGYVDILNKMGAEITTFSQCLGGRECRYNDHSHPHSIIVRGKTPLVGTQIQIPDLKASFAHLIAALVADGKSTLTGVHFLLRSHENIVEKVASLGAKVSLRSKESR